MIAVAVSNTKSAGIFIIVGKEGRARARVPGGERGGAFPRKKTFRLPITLALCNFQLKHVSCERSYLAYTNEI